MDSLTIRLAAGPTYHAERFAHFTNSPERLAPSTEGDLKAIARRCLERMLGHPLTPDDAAILPGIDVSALLAATPATSPGQGTHAAASK
jgi:hypothetical protein